jgi:DNA-binding CsgD family transcriptional regulator
MTDVNRSFLSTVQTIAGIWSTSNRSCCARSASCVRTEGDPERVHRLDPMSLPIVSEADSHVLTQIGHSPERAAVRRVQRSRATVHSSCMSKELPAWLPAWVAGYISNGLAEINVPAYLLDSTGVIRWMNPHALELLGDHRGAHFTAPVAPEAKPVSQLEFRKKVLGTARASDYHSVLRLRSGVHVSVEIHAVALNESHRIVGIFGIVDVPSPSTGRRPPPAAGITPRQHEVLRSLARGLSTAQMSELMGISPETVRNHVKALLRALGVNSRLEALVEARQRGLID